MQRKIKNEKIKRLTKGFSLIEIMVSLSLFIVVIVISMGSILSVLDANKKSQSLRAVMDNLNITLESMSRTIRFGQDYRSWGCPPLPPLPTDPHDCNLGDSSLTVKASNASYVTYQLTNGRIGRVVDGGSEAFITSPDVTITKLAFYVFGSAPYGGGTDL